VSRTRVCIKWNCYPSLVVILRYFEVVNRYIKYVNLRISASWDTAPRNLVEVDRVALMEAVIAL
jgi:hypothetical protein